MPRLFVLSALCTLCALSADEGEGYKKAPPAVRKILDLPPPPVAQITPRRDALLLADYKAYPAIEEAARPYLKLAGHRVDPETLETHLARHYTRLTLQPLDGGKSVRVEVPEGIRPGLPVWSPDGKRFALAAAVDDACRLFVGDATGKLTPIGTRLNASLGEPIHWMPDGKTILCLEALPPEERKPKKAPPAPVVRESSGKSAPARTYQDLLKDEDDARVFGLATASRVRLVPLDGGEPRSLGEPASISAVSPSPDGKLLLVTTIRPPYSYSLPASHFPQRVEAWDLEGKAVATIADLPLADKVPIDGTRPGPRAVQWHPTAPRTVVWVEALDGGDPRKKATHRDRVVGRVIQPKTDDVEVYRTTHRFSSLAFTEDGYALISDYERDKRRRRTWRVSLLKAGGDKPRLVFDHATEDRYNDPGTPLTRRTATGHRVVRTNGEHIFLTGEGATAKGSRPFLDRFSLKTLKAERLFLSAANAYESVLDVLKPDGSRFLTRHESRVSPPNYFVREAGKEEGVAVTSFTDAAPELRKVTRRLVVYKRGDGVLLSFTLYLPPGYKEGTRLPTVVWAYPREFGDPALAGQVAGSQARFTTVSGPSHLFFLLAGYAVLDGVAMPVVGPAEKANDTFVEQITASASAAIDKAVELGVTDRRRVGVGGHSYGAFMTANLLAHTDLFRAGVARSGAYNRTLTPFGFQNERRTLWQAPEVYAKMSPFMHAHKIDEPLLIIHGADDNNSGTFPIQSERLFQAIRGNGGTARYVSLPHESHGYAARESVEHALAEMIDWFDRHVKNATPRKGAK